MDIKQYVRDSLIRYKSILMYLVFGVLTTLVNIIIFWFFSDYLLYDVVPSNVIAWALAVLFAYVTNKLFVFESKSLQPNILLREFGSFLAFRLASGGIDTAIMFVCVDLLTFDKMLTKIAANVIVVVLNYIFSKFFIFNKHSI